MGQGSKLLICGLENSGKTTLTSNLEEVMVVQVDNKRYPFNVPHYRVEEYKGIADFKNTLVEKLKAYKEKYGKRPRTVVFDTVTKLYELMYKYSQENFKGFDIHNSISNDTLAFNTLVEKLLIQNGVNVVVTAHVVHDENTSRYVVPATGIFAKTGSWLSIVDEASYIYTQGNERWISHSELKYPCRTTLDLKKAEPLSQYDINEHMKALEAKADDAEECAL